MPLFNTDKTESPHCVTKSPTEKTQIKPTNTMSYLFIKQQGFSAINAYAWHKANFSSSSLTSIRKKYFGIIPHQKYGKQSTFSEILEEILITYFDNYYRTNNMDNLKLSLLSTQKMDYMFR